MIELINLTKIYHSNDGGSIALQNISIKFPEIGFVALTGQSGSGKTTLLNVLSGFQTYEEGDMYINGIDALTFQNDDWQNYQKNEIGFIFQDYGLIESYKVIDNIIIVLQILGMSFEESYKKAEEYLELVHLLDVKNKKVINLSSGQKQRLSIARAIAKEPKIILCDEPTANLDPENSKEIMKILGDIAKKCLVIVSTHNYDDAKGYANYFIRLYKGSLISYETVNEHIECPQKTKDYNKPNPFIIFFTYLKNRKIRFGLTNFLVFIISLLLIIILSIFAYNLDDANTKIVDHDVFNNVSDKELIIRKNDNSSFSEEELNQLMAIKHINNYEKYGLASDMNYYYRPDIDYRYDVEIVYVDSPSGIVEHNEYKFNKFNKSLFLKSYLGKVASDDLKDGGLPSSMFEVVASNEYTVGDEITVYLDNSTTLGANELSLNVKVSGVLKEHSDDLYFSLEFMRQMDYIQKANYGNEWYIYIVYKDIRNRQKNATLAFVPIYDGNDKEETIEFSKKYVDNFQGGFPSTIDECFILRPSMYSSGEQPKTMNVSLNLPQTGAEQITSRFLIVSKDVYDFVVGDYQEQYSRIYIDEYPYINNVIRDLKQKGYDVMSPYRASSSKYDPDKIIQRSNALIISLVSFAGLSLLYLAIFIIIVQMKRKEELVMLRQGASKKLLGKFNLIDLFASSIFALVLGLLAYIIIRSFNNYLFEASKYVRWYHYLIVFLLINILTYLASVFHNNKISKAKVTEVE